MFAKNVHVSDSYSPPGSRERRLLVHTFRKCLFHFCPGIRTLTVFCIFPALTTTPTSDLFGLEASPPATSEAAVGIIDELTNSEIVLWKCDGVIADEAVASMGIGDALEDPDDTSVAKHRALRQA